MDYYARSEGVSGEKQLLRDHLQKVAELAGGFAEDAGLPREMGEWAGWLHDLGKYSDEFQRHRLCLNPDGTPNGEQPWRVEHACHGAAFSFAAARSATRIAFAVAAHHSGIHNLSEIEDLDKRFEQGTLVPQELPVLRRAAEFVKRAIEDGAFTGLPPGARLPDKNDQEGWLAFELETRLLFSSLVDADRLDAEGFGDVRRSTLRQTAPGLAATERLGRVLGHIREMAANSKGAPNLVDLRNRVLEHVLARAEQPPGFYSLTVPTGGGKTLTSLAWALRHAANNGQRRIIFVIPYLSIIEQNVEVIRRAVGDEAAVLEHHSNVVDEEDEDEGTGSDCLAGPGLRRKLLAENWDAPIIVTTTVQFFDALFSNRPKKARRLHNIARSVVIFDEAQSFPPKFMEPICALLQQLAVEPFRTSFLFCTATQPALTVDVGGNDSRPRGPLIAAPMAELVPAVPDLFRDLKRVEYVWPREGETATPEGLAVSMHAAGSALAIANTKEQARVLFADLRALDPRTLHLSTRMCAAHRLQVLAEVRRRLTAKEPCLLVATQLIEAGVDVDFPAVWRAMGPLDSIAQAGGRCNREGRLDGMGRVTVFNTWDGKLPGGAYRVGAAITTDIMSAIGGAGPAMHHPDTFQDYFRRFYTTQSLDKEKIQRKRQALDFPEVAAKFKIIDEDTTPVLVPWGDGAAIVARLLADPEAEIAPADFRRMQRFVVGLYPRELERAEEAGPVEELPSGVRVFTGRYDEALGLVLPGDYSED